MSSTDTHTIDIIEPSRSEIRYGQSSSRIEPELSTNSTTSSTSPTSTKSNVHTRYWIVVIVGVIVTLALVLGLKFGLHHNNNETAVDIRQANICINQTTAFYQDTKQVQAQAQHSAHTLSHALPFHILGVTQNGITHNGESGNGLARNGESQNGLARNGGSLNGMGLNGMGLNGMGLNGVSLNRLSANRLAANGIGLNGRNMNGIGLNALTTNAVNGNGIQANGMGLNGIQANGMGLNGIQINGIGLNGQNLNGIGLNGQNLNGIGLNGQNLNGKGLNGQNLNGMGLNGQNLNGRSINGRDLNGVQLNGLDGFNTLQLQHGIPSHINGLQLNLDANITQALKDAIANTNITTLMDVPLIGLKPNWTGILDFVPLSPELSQLSHLFMKYLFECALNDTQAIGFVWDTCDKDSTTHAEVFHGSMGLAPEWMNGPMLPENARFVSACLAARTNYYGVHVMISMRGPSPISSFINTIDKDEQQAYNATEGAFWGDIWNTENPELYACYHDKPQDQRTYSRSLKRDCASGHINPTTGAVEECGPIHIVGACSQVCEGWNEENQYYTACRHNNTIPYSPEVITVALQSPQ